MKFYFLLFTISLYFEVNIDLQLQSHIFELFAFIFFGLSDSYLYNHGRRRRRLTTYTTFCSSLSPKSRNSKR
ncbi:hypothetical protein L1887_25262 [Cichorium endivia]|nr:hypothetical protein L1887_25262 [Cichorium endivia]